MERQPVKTIPIHEHLRPRLCDTYENDSIFDKFEVVFSGNGDNVMTGSYNNNFMIYPSAPDAETEVVLQADKSAFKAKKVGVPTPMNSAASAGSGNGNAAGTGTGKKSGSRAASPAAGQGSRMRKETDADQIDFNKKILHMSWHPFEDSIAIAATNNVCLAFFSSSSFCSTFSSFLSHYLFLSPIHSSIHFLLFSCPALLSTFYTFIPVFRHLPASRQGTATDIFALALCLLSTIAVASAYSSCCSSNFRFKRRDEPR